MAAINVRERKKELIIERIDCDPVARRGMRISRAAILALLLLRLSLFVYELVYLPSAGLEVGVISSLLLIPMLFILYMIYDGNKGLAGVLLISAVVRSVYLFASAYPTLPKDSAAGVYVGAYLFVMAFQFVSLVLVTAYAPCTKYFEKMQSINMDLSVLLKSPASTPRQHSSGNGKSHKKKKK